MAKQKLALRREARARRAEAAGRAAAEAVVGHALRLIGTESWEIVAGFIAISTELDPAPLMAALSARGTSLCLPFVQGEDQPLLFRRYRPGDALVPGPHGTLEPEAKAPLLRPATLLVPLLAFDAKGWRLGYGGGYYDRTLRAMRAKGHVRAIGLAYAAQERASVPHDEKDERLDLIVTEQGVMSCAGAK